MPNSFAFPKPPMVQSIMDKEGTMSPQWLRWFNQVFAQIENAAYTPANVDITGGTIGGDAVIDTTGTITTTAAFHAASGVITGNLVVGGNISAANFSGTTSGSNTGDQTISATGDVTAAGTSAVLATTITAHAVTYAKIQALSGAALLGATAAGNVSEIPLSGRLAFVAGSLDTVGITAVIATAKLTGGGANGSMTFTNGILTAHTDAT